MRLTPRYTLVTFNDYGPDIKRNVEVVLDTSDIKVNRDQMILEGFFAGISYFRSLDEQQQT